MNYRCPVSRCTGWVSFIEDDPPFWSCGYCGSMWYEEVNLLAEVDLAIKTYPYRGACYEKAGGKWSPADPAKIPNDYEEQVESEPDDESDDFIRG